MMPLARTLASVPDSVAGRASALVTGGAVRSAPPRSSASAGAVAKRVSAQARTAKPPKRPPRVSPPRSSRGGAGGGALQDRRCTAPDFAEAPAPPLTPPRKDGEGKIARARGVTRRPGLARRPAPRLW